MRADVRNLVWPELRAPLTLALLVPVPVVSVLLLARRVSGALEYPLPAGIWLAFGVFLAVWTFAVRRVFASRLTSRSWRHPSMWLPIAVCGVVVAALLVPGTWAGSVAGFLAVFAVEEAVSLRWLTRRKRHKPIVPLEKLNAEFPADITKQLVRRREADGHESISGWVRVEFAPNQRVASAHVAFCPPFAQLPSCEAEVVEGAASTARVAQVLPNGARIEIKIDAPSSQPVGVIVEFAAAN